jgi:hypothetical protein
MIPALKKALAPGTDVIKWLISPPVHDSATERVNSLLVKMPFIFSAIFITLVSIGY